MAEEEKHDEPEKAVPKIVLKQSIITAGLSQLGQTYDGTSYAFTKLVIDEKEFEIIGPLIQKYPNLRDVSMCKNQLRTIAEISDIPYLLSFKASNNQIETLNGLQDANKLKYLQILFLNSNKIKELIPVNLTHLRHLNLNDNEIASCEKFAGSTSIECLELRKNKLKNLKGLENMPKLTEIYVAENELTTIDGLKNLPALKRLHLRKNAIIKLQPIPTLPALEYLNIRENPIENAKELINLKSLNTLKRISIKGTPPGDEFGDGAKKELIILLGEYIRFQVVNKAEITKEDIAEAAEEKKERKKKEEEAKLEAERLAKEQAEQKKEEEVKA